MKNENGFKSTQIVKIDNDFVIYVFPQLTIDTKSIKVKKTTLFDDAVKFILDNVPKNELFILSYEDSFIVYQYITDENQELKKGWYLIKTFTFDAAFFGNEIVKLKEKMKMESCFCNYIN